MTPIFVLDPLLFSLYITDIIQCIEYEVIQKFADDIQIVYDTDPKLTENCLNLVNEGEEKMVNWCSANYLSLNSNKTQVMILGTAGCRGSPSPESIPSVIIEGTPISDIEQVKLLGPNLSSTLNQNIPVTDFCGEAWSTNNL